MGRRTYVAMFNDGVATFLATEWGSEGVTAGAWRREWRHTGRAAEGAVEALGMQLRNPGFLWPEKNVVWYLYSA